MPFSKRGRLLRELGGGEFKEKEEEDCIYESNGRQRDPHISDKCAR